MFESTREHKGNKINWRKMKRIHKNARRSNKLSVKDAKEIFGAIAKKAQNENLNDWQYLRNFVNWI